MRHLGEEVGDGAEDARHAARVAGGREGVEAREGELVEHAEADDLADDPEDADVLAVAQHLLHLGQRDLEVEAVAPLERRARVAVRQDVAQTDALARAPALHRLHVHVRHVLQPERHVQLVLARREHGEQLRGPERAVVALGPDALLGEPGHLEEALPGLSADGGLRRAELRLDGVVDGVADHHGVVAVLQARRQHALVGRGAVQRGHRDLLHRDPVAHRHVRERAQLREEGARADRPGAREPAVLDHRAGARLAVARDQRVHHDDVRQRRGVGDVALHVPRQTQARRPRGGLREELDVLFLRVTASDEPDRRAHVDEVALLRHRHVELDLAKMPPENGARVAHGLHTTLDPQPRFVLLRAGGEVHVVVVSERGVAERLHDVAVQLDSKRVRTAVHAHVGTRVQRRVEMDVREDLRRGRIEKHHARVQIHLLDFLSKS